MWTYGPVQYFTMWMKRALVYLYDDLSHMRTNQVCLTLYEHLKSFVYGCGILCGQGVDALYILKTG